MIFFIYVVSVLLVILPLAHIVKTKQLQKYFVYSVAVVTFLGLNLLGSISPSILSYHAVGYHLVFLTTALLLNLSYVGLELSTQHHAITPCAQRLQPSFFKNVALLKAYLVIGIFVILIGGIVFTLTISPPLFFRFDLFHDLGLHHAKAMNLSEKTLNLLGASGSLINERMRIVTLRPFHWLALCIFELPLFLVLLTAVCYFTVRNTSQKLFIQAWLKIFICMTAIALITSVWILSKQYTTYLIFGFCLVIFLFKKYVDLKMFFYLSMGLFVFLMLSYALYDGGMNQNFFILLLPTLFHRIMEIYPWSGAVAYNIFPHHIPFLEGKSMINLFHLFHFEQVSVANIIYPKIYGMRGGSAPLPAIFESYANWGWMGVIAAECLIVLTICGVTWLSWSKNIWFFSLACYLTVKLILFWQAPLWFGVYEPTLIFFVLVMIGVYKCFYWWYGSAHNTKI